MGETRFDALKAAAKDFSAKREQWAAGRAAARAAAAGRFTSGMDNYIGLGAMYTMGFDPYAKSVHGDVLFRSPAGVPMTSNLQTAYSANAALSDSVRIRDPRLMSRAARMRTALPGSILGPGLTALNIGYGYAESGLSGAFNAAAIDLATMSSLYRHGVAPKLAKAAAGTAIKTGFFRQMPRLLSAGVGATLGAQIGGPVGALVGGHVMGSTVGMIAGYGAAAAGGLGYGVYKTVQAGHAHRKRQKQLETSGDMSAFMTRGAMTMRARAVSAIHKSHLNARSALGTEAGFMHQPSRNYHSRYRGYY